METKQEQSYADRDYADVTNPNEGDHIYSPQEHRAMLTADAMRVVAHLDALRHHIAYVGGFGLHDGEALRAQQHVARAEDAIHAVLGLIGVAAQRSQPSKEAF